MEHYDDDQHINIGTGEDLSIRELAEADQGHRGAGVAIRFDPSKPDGTPANSSTSAGCIVWDGAHDPSEGRPRLNLRLVVR